MDEKDMFIEYFQYLCPHVLMNEEETVAKKCLLLVENITNTSVSDLMSTSFMVLLFVPHYSNRENILRS